VLLGAAFPWLGLDAGSPDGFSSCAHCSLSCSASAERSPESPAKSLCLLPARLCLPGDVATPGAPDARKGAASAFSTPWPWACLPLLAPPVDALPSCSLGVPSPAAEDASGSLARKPEARAGTAVAAGAAEEPPNCERRAASDDEKPPLPPAWLRVGNEGRAPRISRDPEPREPEPREPPKDPNEPRESASVRSGKAPAAGGVCFACGTRAWEAREGTAWQAQARGKRQEAQAGGKTHRQERRLREGKVRTRELQSATSIACEWPGEPTLVTLKAEPTSARRRRENEELSAEM